jgi:hypothetical protein
MYKCMLESSSYQYYFSPLGMKVKLTVGLNSSVSEKFLENNVDIDEPLVLLSYKDYKNLNQKAKSLDTIKELMRSN